MKCFLYILKSEKDNGYYVGITQDLEKRLQYHNSGRVKSTKSRHPFKMIYSEIFESIPQAREREKYLKSYKGSREKLGIIQNTASSSNG